MNKQTNKQTNEQTNKKVRTIMMTETTIPSCHKFDIWEKGI